MTSVFAQPDTSGGRTWLVIGGGDAADSRKWAHLCTGGPGAPRVATTNHGIEHCRDADIRPDMVWLSDPVAVKNWHDIVRRWQQRGTSLISCTRARQVMADYNLATDEQVAIDLELRRYRPGAWSAPRFSGLMLVQYLLNRCCPRKLILAGFEAYPPEEESQAYRIGPWLQSAIDADPGVAWEIFGHPLYDVRGAAMPNRDPVVGPVVAGAVDQSIPAPFGRACELPGGLN